MFIMLTTYHKNVNKYVTCLGPKWGHVEPFTHIPGEILMCFGNHHHSVTGAPISRPWESFTHKTNEMVMV